MPHDLIILRGAPGTGKTTVAKHLIKHLPTGATVEVDHIRRMMHGLCWKDDKLHFKAIIVAAATARALLEEGRGPIVFVDTLGYGRLEFARAKLGSASAKVYSLVCHDPLLSLRLLRRTGGYRDVRSARRFNTHIAADAGRYPVIDTTWSRAAQVAGTIFLSEGEPT